MVQNPFLETLVINYIRVIKRDVPPGQELYEGDFYDVEEQGHSRVYKSAAGFEKLMSLPMACHRLFIWIQYNIGEGQDSIVIEDAKLADSVFQCSDKTVARMKALLRDAGVIAKAKENRYWVNPRYIAAGSRLRLFPGNTLRVAIRKEKPRI